MLVPKKVSVVIVEHSNSCFLKSKEDPWSGITDGHYWGDWRAKEKSGMGLHHIWHRVTCNDPNCPAIKAVHSSVLANA